MTDFDAEVRRLATEPETVDAGTANVLHAMVTVFSDVLGAMDQRMANMEAAVRGLQADEAEAATLRRAIDSVQGVGAMEAELAAMRAALVDHPAATVHTAVERMSQQIDALCMQPGPGPAMGMIAAGLAERFEERTQLVVSLLQEHAEYMGALTEEVNVTVQRLEATVEARQAGLDALLDTLRAVASSVETMGVRVEEATDRINTVLDAGEALPEVVQGLKEIGGALAEQALALDDTAAVNLATLVRTESELLAQRISAVAVAVDALQEALGGHPDLAGGSLGRKASEAGRRLVADLGFAAKPKPKPREEPPEPG